VWAVAGGLFMFAMALALETEMKDFPGGPKALAASIGPTAEAMRILRWPADRLDTVGGYLTYHNVILLNLALAVYGAVQGVRAVRGGEERHVVEELLATGESRTALVRDRALGFVGIVLVIVLGLGVATASGLALVGAPDLYGVVVTVGTSGLVAVVGFAFGLAVSQLLAGSRSAAGLASAVLVGLYVVTNLDGELGPVVGALRWLSPFHYANQSRAMVPGEGLDLVATAVLVGMALGLLWLGAAAFERRDYAAALWSRRRTGEQMGRHDQPLPTALLGSVWTAALRRGAFGLLAWAAGAAVLTGTFAALQPSVMEVWTGLDYLVALVGGGTGVSVQDMYWAFVGEMIAPLIAAFVVVQSCGWVGDLAQGRVEMLLAGPVSWSRLVVERLVALVVGVLTITAVAVVTLVVGGLAVGGSLDPAGLARLTVVSVFFGAALGGLAALAVAWVRRPASVTLLATIVLTSYMLTMLVALFEWPEWLNRLSVFWAFGHPYLEWPPSSALTVLLLVATGGTLLAARVAERTPKVA
jgi:ABC-2 type transport system permease protein